ncbi:hypothetical protein GCM10027577_19630 [Spirosoma fluminis]
MKKTFAIAVFIYLSISSLQSFALKVKLSNGTTVECKCTGCTPSNLAESWNNSPGTMVCCNRGTDQETCFNKASIVEITYFTTGEDTSSNKPLFSGLAIAVGLMLVALAIYLSRGPRMPPIRPTIPA